MHTYFFKMNKNHIFPSRFFSLAKLKERAPLTIHDINRTADTIADILNI